MWNVRFIGVYGYVTPREELHLKWSVAAAVAWRVPIIDRLFLSEPGNWPIPIERVIFAVYERERVQQRSAKVVRAVIRDLFLGHCFDSGFLLLATGLILISSLYILRYFYVRFAASIDLLRNIRFRNAIFSSSQQEWNDSGEIHEGAIHASK